MSLVSLDWSEQFVTVHWLYFFELLHLERRHFLAHVFECSFDFTKFIDDTRGAIGQRLLRVRAITTRVLSELSLWVSYRGWHSDTLRAPTSSKFLGRLLSWYSFARCGTVFLHMLFDYGRLFRQLNAGQYGWLLLLGLCLITQVFGCLLQELLLKLLVFKFKVFAFEYICRLVPLAKPSSVFLVSNLTCFVL